MIITVESTTKTVEIEGVPARVWEGMTASGIPVHCYVTRIAVNADAHQAQFEAELTRHRSPRNADIDAIPLRLLL